MEYKISQSGLKDLERTEGCPALWKANHIDKEVEFIATPAMKTGQYFEHLCLGTDTGVLEIPKLKSGKESVEETRIKLQSEIFKSFYDKSHPDFQGWTVVEKDVKLHDDTTKGIIDYVIENDKGERMYMDLKLVQDLYQGYYMFGHHDVADYTQQIFYQRILDSLGINAKVGLLIFEKGKSMRIKEISPIDITPLSIEAIDFRINRAYDVMAHYNRNGWPKVPDEMECNRCPLKCDRRFVVPELEITEEEIEEVEKYQRITLEI